MVQCVVIADEITGASAVGALLQKNKNRVCSLLNSRAIRDPAIKDYDCIVYSTNSRNITPAQSYQIVFSAGRLLKSDNVRVYAKRIDPAMRGNTCTETQAMLDALGDNRMAVVVPAFPELRRSNVGGYILIDGKPIQKSLVGMDDILTEGSGRVADLFIEKFRYRAEPIFMKDLFRGKDYLAQKLKEMQEKGVRAVVFDGISQQDINTVADAVIKSQIRFLAVDPGPFTATVSRKLMYDGKADNKEQKILCLVGGSNPLIAAQVEMLRLEDKDVLFVSVDTMQLIDDEQKRTAEIERVVTAVLSQQQDHSTVMVMSDLLGASAQILANFAQLLEHNHRSRIEAMDLISGAYGQIVSRILMRSGEFNAVYASGAEYTSAICRECRSFGLDIQGQVTPLTAYGKMIGGQFPDLSFITAASSATNADNILQSMQYLRRKLVL